MNNNFSYNRRALLKTTASVSLLSALPVIAGCSFSNTSYLANIDGIDQQSPIIYWSDIMLQAIRDQSLSPLRASRVFALAHLSGSLALGNQHCQHQQLSAAVPNNLNHALAYGVAFSHACEEALGTSLMFPRRTFVKASSDKNQTASIQWGKTVAKQVIQSRIKDGSEDSKSLFYPADYPKRRDELAWSPTGPFYSANNGPAFNSFERGYRPGWGAQQPWCIGSVKEYEADPFPEVASTEFKRQFEKVKSLGNGRSQARSAEQAEIALFWEDGPRGITISGHFQLLAIQLLGKLNLSLQEQAKFLASFSVAQADGAIIAWHNKYKTDVLRPETAIRFADTRFQHQGLGILSDSGWRSFIPTPPFPTYISGHSIIGAVSSEILALMLGSDRVNLSSTSPDQINWQQLKGVTRSWQSLRAIAEENGISREFGGVHWEIDNTEGLRLGYQLANKIYTSDYLGGA